MARVAPDRRAITQSAPWSATRRSPPPRCSRWESGWLWPRSPSLSSTHMCCGRLPWPTPAPCTKCIGAAKTIRSVCIRGATTRRSARGGTCLADVRGFARRLRNGRDAALVGQAGERQLTSACSARVSNSAGAIEDRDTQTPLGDDVIVLGYGAWKSAFQLDPGVLGKKSGTARSQLRNNRRRRSRVRRPGRIAARLLGADVDARSVSQGRDGGRSHRPLARRREQDAGRGCAGGARPAWPAGVARRTGVREPPSFPSLRR